MNTQTSWVTRSFKNILRLKRAGGPAQVADLSNPTAGEMLYHEYLEVLHREGGKDGYLSNLRRNLIINTFSLYWDEGGSKFRTMKSIMETQMGCQMS